MLKNMLAAFHWCPTMRYVAYQLITKWILFSGMAFLTPWIASASQAPPDTQSMTLNACIETALENSPELKVSYGEQAFQAEAISLARSAFLPRIDALSGYTRFEYPMRVTQAHENNEPGVFDRDLLETGIVFRLPVYQGGQHRAELAIAQLGRLQAMEIWKGTRQDLILNLHAVFYKILQIDEVQRSAMASMQALEAHKTTTRLQLEVGRVAPVDVMKIDVRLAQIEQQLSSIQADRKALIAALLQLMGMDRANLIDVDIRGELKAHPTKLPNMALARKRAENQRPELAAARLELDRTKAGVKAARAVFLPQVDGFGTYSLRAAIPFDDDHEDAWSAGLQVNLPLFHGGANIARLRQAEIRRKQADERHRAVTLKIETDLEQSLARLTDSLKRMEVNRKNMTLSSETFRIEQAKNEDGKSSINDLLDAQAATLAAEVAHSQSVMDYLLARVEWRRAVGTPLWPVAETGKE
ncbi:MAG: TolC family protein [Desulfobacterales bacterium]|jgi:outer membrane protein TolC|nr:TolC family protein [Desulfobacterales bacterium]